jgi:hypothetical protein
MKERATPLDTALVHSMITSYLAWSERSELATYDWWDLWARGSGSRAKALYARNRFLGGVAVAPFLALDLVWPGVRRFIASRRAFPICHAHMGLGFLNMHAATGERRYLERAEALVQPLLAMACPGTTGLGWGMKHDWMTIAGLIPRDTPCNTQTAYAYEFLAELHARKEDSRYEDLLAATARHVATDFHEWSEGDRLACSYSTRDRRRVVNANSYRALILVDAGCRLGEPIYTDKGLRTVRFVLSMQHLDGSWPYSEDEPFVDTYHTCFVLKNLHKISKLVPGVEGLSAAIERGLRFYFDRLYDGRGNPIPFAVKPRLVLHEYDAYDVAESIGLLAEMNLEHGRLDHLLRLAHDRFQTREGWFAFRTYRFPAARGIPYLRYANSAMFLALSKVLRLGIGGAK